MQENFATVQPWILAHEGEYVNHPRDPGGSTNQGVTQGTYDGWRRAHKLPVQDVRKMTASERDTIYREDYWQVIRGDDLPSGVDYAVYDFAVNSGPSRAAKYLQRVVGAQQDGIIGSKTLAAVGSNDPELIVRRLCNDRMDFLRDLPHWPTFGRGWTRRVVGQFEGAQDDDTGVVDRAVKLARSETPEAPTSPAPGKAIAGPETPQDAPTVPEAPAVAEKPATPRPAAAPSPAVVVSSSGEVLANQPTTRTSRKVEYSSRAAGLAGLAGAVLGSYTFTLTPVGFQEVDLAMELWTGSWAGGIAWITSLQLGRRVRERVENMLITT